MFIPVTPPLQFDQDPSRVIVAFAGNTSSRTSIHTIGECQLVDNGPTVGSNGETSFNSAVTYTLQAATSDLQKFGHHNDITLEDLSTAKVSVIQKPSHGIIVIDKDDPSGTTLLYQPNLGYFGDDFAVTMAKLMGTEVKVFHFFHVLNGPTVNLYDSECGKRGGEWKISSSPSTPPSSGIYNQPHVNPWDNFYPNVTINFENLTGALLGEAKGQSITLDPTAGGHGWFVDPTPSQNEEFLPTSDPNEWIARPGSAADGKMDMLAVLPHEYGHVLGLDRATGVRFTYSRKISGSKSLSMQNKK